ncbi:MAG: apolipoprotein N-acyltransferase [Candidatus Omnitrophica bacterium]|nr:apolipoprotein N-acyltransferase [Candidatus Omnitrophota bacterium]
MLRKISSPALSIAAAVLLSLSFSSFNLWQLAWLGFVPLFAALENKSLFRSFILSYLSGVIFWSFTVYWLVHVTLLGTIILILYLALYFGLFGISVAFLRRIPVNGVLFLPSFWVVLEYIRSYLFTGFPWAQLAFSQYKNLPVIQIADITGAWGVSFLVVFVNSALYFVLTCGLPVAARVKKLIVPILCLSVVLAYGYCKIYRVQRSESQAPIKISVIQGNIPQDLKWDKQAIGFIQNRYEELTNSASADRPDLIIWPEASVPFLWGEDESEFRSVYSLVRRINTHLLVGTVSHYGEKYYNSALFIDKSGTPQAIYNKLHLVPFGEFVPFKNIFPFLATIAPIGDITAGKDYTIFKYPQPFGVLICFEDLFPELSRQFVKRGAKFLVNITNDAWYKEGSAPYQHFAASVFRAVENRAYLARSANTGISGFIDPFGKILSVVEDARGKEIFVRGKISQDIYPGSSAGTFYSHYGDFFVVLCMLLVAYAIMSIIKNKR